MYETKNFFKNNKRSYTYYIKIHLLICCIYKLKLIFSFSLYIKLKVEIKSRDQK